MADTTAVPALDEFLETPDLSELDPSTQGGFRISYAQAVPLEMRLQTTDAAPAEAGTLEAIYCKVAVAESPDGRPKHVKIELSSEADLFFHYTHVTDEKAFNAMRDEQKLMIDFNTYAAVLASSFRNAIKEPHTFLAVFIMNRDGQARLDFIQNVSFKFVELLSINFTRSSDEIVRSHITYRYNTCKSQVAVLQARLQDVVNLVKVKNPSLLLQLQKPAVALPTGTTHMGLGASTGGLSTPGGAGAMASSMGGGGASRVGGMGATAGTPTWGGART